MEEIVKLYAGFPVTKAEAVYLPNGKKLTEYIESLEKRISQLQSQLPSTTSEE